MRALLVVLTAAEIALVVVVLAVYLVKIGTSLRSTAMWLAKVTFGVRAIEKQVAPVGGLVTRINAQLEALDQALAGLAGRATGRAAAGASRRTGD